MVDYKTRKAALAAMMQAKEQGEDMVVRQTCVGRASRNGPGPRAKVYRYHLELKS